MKKIFSFIIVFTMIISSFSLVSFAAEPIRTPVSALVVLKDGDFSTADNYEEVVQSEPNATFDFRAELDMQNVKTALNTALAGEFSGYDPTLYVVSGEFEIKIEYPNNASFNASAMEAKSSNLGSTDFLHVSTIYEFTSSGLDTTDPDKKVVTIKFKVKDGTTVQSLLDNDNALLSNAVFQVDDVIVTAYGSYPVDVSLKGSTVVKKNVIGATPIVSTKREYEGFSRATAVVTPPSSTGGGGGVRRYTLTYETNGGSLISSEMYEAGKVAELAKTPKKDGYIFAGWYLDEELTQAVSEVKMNKNITVYANWIKDNGTAGSGYDTPDILNGDDHFAYVVGYPDGTVRPNDNITRAEVTAIFFRLLKEATRTEAFTETNNFDDVNEEDWYNNPVSTMAKLGIVNGRAVGEFAPNAFITRAEFAAICARFDDSQFEIVDEFTDISGHWAENEIHESAAHGWIKGYEDKSFKPDQFITRAEAMTMINRVLNRVPEVADDLLDGMIKWPDNSDVSAWYYLPVQEATNSHECDKKNKIYEKWTDLRDVTDWTEYEK